MTEKSIIKTQEDLYQSIFTKGRSTLLQGGVSTQYIDSRDNHTESLILRATFSDTFQNIIWEKVEEVLYKDKDVLRIIRKLLLHPPDYYHLTLATIIPRNVYNTIPFNVIDGLKRDLKDILEKCYKFKISLRGLCLSDDTVFIKGFTSRELLQLRKNLKDEFNLRSIPFYEKNSIFAAHLSIIRFKESFTPQECNHLISFITNNSEICLGAAIINEVKLDHQLYLPSHKKASETVETYRLK